MMPMHRDSRPLAHSSTRGMQGIDLDRGILPAALATKPEMKNIYPLEAKVVYGLERNACGRLAAHRCNGPAPPLSRATVRLLS